MDRARTSAELDEVVAHIRRRSGFAGFLGLPDTATMQAATSAGPVVLVNTSVLGSHAFVVTSPGIDCVELPELEPGGAGAEVARFRAALDVALDAVPGSAEGCRAEDELHRVLEWLWDAVAAPVLRRLGRPAAGALPRMWWSATGFLALLPLHAAGHHRDGSGRTLLDHTVCSTTPTLRALAHANRARRPGGPGLRSCVVVEAGTGGLPGTRTEADHLVHLVGPVTRLRGGRLTVADVLAELPRHRWAHFACHGFADPAHPSDSGLDVTGDGGDTLTVATVSRLQLDHGELAFLAACDTARSGPVLADEVITLASAFQLAGYRQVVGTLWPVLDTVAVRFARRVYGTVATAGPDALPRAVPAAVLDLRRRHPDLPSVWAAPLHAGR